MEKLFIPILLGTTRPKRESEKVAKLIEKIGKDCREIEVELVDPQNYNFPYDGNDPENKDPRYSALTEKADGFVIVVPEYNHSFPGSLKRMLDSELENYIHKPVAFAGVSNGLFAGARAIESLVPSVRELGLVATFSDLYFPRVHELFNEDGSIKDEGYIKRIDRMFTELIWMANTLKYGRKHIKSIYH